MQSTYIPRINSQFGYNSPPLLLFLFLHQSGYGSSSGEPTEYNTYGDIMAVYEYMAQQGYIVDPATEVSG